MIPAEFMREYERRTNTHRFEEVAPLIAEHAVYWFSDGSFRGIDEIRRAFEETWAVIRDEVYSVEDVQWLVQSGNSAVCIYIFRWRGIVEGQQKQGMGRGTSVLTKIAERWQVVHERLSPIP
jgi:ketosteroid isomerase-like protein